MQAARAPYASQPDQSRGRLHANGSASLLEGQGEIRSRFQRDRDRIIHSAAFRKLQQKTQVFIADTFAASRDTSGYFRTRLTHSLEVAQIARSISRHLKLDEDLTEAVALAHDLGHPPFGHAGETALDEAMKTIGKVNEGFDHNEQTIRVMTELEHCYAEFDGLNVTWEVLEGVAKHNGPFDGTKKIPTPTIAKLDTEFSLNLTSHASLEAQIANLADDIAYLAHDCEDGILANLLDPREMRKREVPLVGSILAGLDEEYGDIAELPRLTHELTRRMIKHVVHDVLTTTQEALDATQPQSADDIRGAGRDLAGFSGDMQGMLDGLKDYLYLNFWRHHKVVRTTSRARRMLGELFGRLMDEPSLLPPPHDHKNMPGRHIADYIASMTDSEAQIEYARLFGAGAVLPSLV